MFVSKAIYDALAPSNIFTEASRLDRRIFNFGADGIGNLPYHLRFTALGVGPFVRGLGVPLGDLERVNGPETYHHNLLSRCDMRDLWNDGGPFARAIYFNVRLWSLPGIWFLRNNRSLFDGGLTLLCPDTFLGEPDPARTAIANGLSVEQVLQVSLFFSRLGHFFPSKTGKWNRKGYHEQKPLAEYPHSEAMPDIGHRSISKRVPILVSSSKRTAPLQHKAHLSVVLS